MRYGECAESQRDLLIGNARDTGGVEGSARGSKLNKEGRGWTGGALGGI